MDLSICIRTTSSLTDETRHLFAAVVINTIFWFVIPCDLVDIYVCFGTTYGFHLQYTLKVGVYPTNYTDT